MPLQFHKRALARYSSNVKNYFVDYFQMNRNSLGLNLKVVWITLLCFRYDLQLIFSQDFQPGAYPES
ncbi:hypothetical protein T01_5299 [Trichinella spiralis]|uniref:Uncharacterized protein n=1 Tax=Trichinella spiralis TaxID=6334 RepID=A0A0V1BLY3_TRISP|nr:hypothetical protein T01_5299 [Trichinella spiralis]